MKMLAVNFTCLLNQNGSIHCLVSVREKNRQKKMKKQKTQIKTRKKNCWKPGEKLGKTR
jgi:hypothetical protein